MSPSAAMPPNPHRERLSGCPEGSSSEELVRQGGRTWSSGRPSVPAAWRRFWTHRAQAGPLTAEPAQTPGGIRKRPSVHATAWTEGLGLLGTFTVGSSVEQRGPDMGPEREHLPWLDAAA
jgi:hypothetical protein